LIEKLEELSKKVAQTEETAKLDLSGWDPRTRMGVETAKKLAQESLEDLTKQYKAEATKFVVKVFLTGAADKVNQFISAGEQEGVIAVRGDGMYRKVGEGVERTVDHRTREFGSGQVTRLVEELTEFAKDNGVKELPMPKLDANLLNTTVPTFESTVELCRSAIRATSKDDLNNLVLEREALNKIVAARLAAPVIPVVITGLSKEETEGVSAGLFRTQTNIHVNIDEIDTKKDLVGAVRAKITKSWRAIKGQ
jgi:hypothetical protein